jgi:acetyltransferase-like isoleucine patch superfamily enzyme
MIKIIKNILRPLFIEIEIWNIHIGNALIACLPASPFLNLIKKTILVARGAKIGKRVFIYPGVFIDYPKNMVIGDDAVLSRGVTITTGGGVYIGKRVLIGYSTKILSADHRIPESHKEPIRFSGHIYGKIEIQDDVWICANCVITKGCSVGRGSVIASGGVVTKDIPEFVLAGGVPAKIIKSRSNR